MGWIEDLRGKDIAVDTAPFIYYIERNATYIDIVDPFFDAAERGEFKIFTSVITILETLVQPIRRGNQVLAQKYKELLLYSSDLTVVSISKEIVEEAARLRALHNMQTPDAIQLATAINAGASFFLTNDNGFPSLPVIQVLRVDSLITS